MFSNQMLRTFCESGHERTRMIRDIGRMRDICPVCKAMTTDEAVFRAIPKPYQELTRSTWGRMLADLADIGAIDVILNMRATPYLKTEYPRRNQI